jgi:hypothetical protein
MFGSDNFPAADRDVFPAGCFEGARAQSRKITASGGALKPWHRALGNHPTSDDTSGVSSVPVDLLLSETR